MQGQVKYHEGDTNQILWKHREGRGKGKLSESADPSSITLVRAAY
jgi:hypothetical protein